MSKEAKLLIGVIISGSLAYLIPLYFGKIWLGYFLLTTFTVGYLVTLFRSARIELEVNSSRNIMIGLTGVLIISLSLSFLQNYDRKDYQLDLLMEIRSNIETGITKSDVQKHLLITLRDYHQSEGESILAAAEAHMPEKLGEDGVYISDHVLNNGDLEKETVNYYYEKDEAADELRVIAVSEIAPGKDPDYINYDGQTGMLEISFNVNNEGVAYEVRN